MTPLLADLRSNPRRNWITLVSGLMLAIAGFAWAFWQTSTPEPADFEQAEEVPIQVLRQALVYRDPRTQPGDNLSGNASASAVQKPVTLPHVMQGKSAPNLVFEIPFDIPASASGKPLGVCIFRVSILDSLWIDGNPLRLNPWLSFGQNFRPFPFHQNLPMDLEPGRHTLQIVTRHSTVTPGGLSEVWLGDDRTTQQACLQLHERVKISERASFYILALIGFLAFVAAIIARQRQFMFFALIAGCWVLNRVLLYDFDLSNPSQAALYFLTRPLVCLPIALFCLEFCGKLNEKNAWGLAVFFTMGLASFMFTPPIHWNTWLLVFGLVCIVLCAIVGGMMLFTTFREPGYAKSALSVTLLFGLLANLADILRGFGFLPWAQPSLTYLTIPIICVGLGVLTIENLVKHIERERLSTQQLRQEVERQRLLLESQFRKSKVKNEKLAVFEERKRIMREMHDGLGSQLVSASALVRHPNADQEAIAGLIDGAIQELRLFLDVLSTSSDDAARNSGKSLNVLLAKLRQHIEPVLRTKGIALLWDVDEMPEGLVPSDRARINLLRLMQEALINAVKHARSSQITVRSKTEGLRVALEVIDQGVGMDPKTAAEGSASGYGLKNMYKRASLIGAELVIADAQPGTVVRISMAVETGTPTTS